MAPEVRITPASFSSPPPPLHPYTLYLPTPAVHTRRRLVLSGDQGISDTEEGALGDCTIEAASFLFLPHFF
jgi:hypothetical protein